MKTDHERQVEPILPDYRGSDGEAVVEDEETGAEVRDARGANLRRERRDALLFVALDVCQVLADGDADGEHGDEGGDEHDGRGPHEGQTDRRGRRVVHAKVEQDAADDGDDDERRPRAALQPHRGHGVERTEEKAEGVETGDEWLEVGGDDGAAEEREECADCNRGSRAELAGNEGQVRLVHLVDFDVVQLVDADDVAVAEEKGEETHERLRYERLVEEFGVLEELPGDDGGGTEESTPDRVRADEFPNSAEDALRGFLVVHATSRHLLLHG